MNTVNSSCSYTIILWVASSIRGWEPLFNLWEDICALMSILEAYEISDNPEHKLYLHDGAILIWVIWCSLFDIAKLKCNYVSPLTVNIQVLPIIYDLCLLMSKKGICLFLNSDHFTLRLSQELKELSSFRKLTILVSIRRIVLPHLNVNTNLWTTTTLGILMLMTVFVVVVVQRLQIKM